MTRCAVFITLMLAIIASSVSADASVPTAYRDLYSRLEDKLQSTSKQIDAQWDKSKAPVDFSAELLTVNCNRGVQLLNPANFAGAQLEMRRLKELGVKAVTMSINFPVLSEPFHKFNGTSYQAFLTFYSNVAEEARKQNLKIIVGMGSGIFPGIYSKGSQLNAQGYYGTIKSLGQYRDERTAMAVVVAKVLRPDYLSLGEEPDTETQLTKLPLNDPQTYIGIVSHQVKHIRAAEVKGLKVGAGVGTWQRDAESWVRAYCKIDLDYIGLHVYPINSLSSKGPHDFLWDLFRLADIAEKSGKAVGVGECWLYKTGDNELGSVNSVTDPAIFQRDVYSFWQPLDAQFLSIMVRGAHWKKFAFLSPFWTRILYGGYLDYDRIVPGTGTEQLFIMSNRKAVDGLRAGTFSQTGRAYGQMIKGDL